MATYLGPWQRNALRSREWQGQRSVGCGMTITNCFADDNKLRAVFSWLTLIGAGPKFGTRSIAWYQGHQCNAIDALRNTGIEQFRYHCGMIQGKQDKRWKNLFTPNELYAIADKC